MSKHGLVLLSFMTIMGLVTSAYSETILLKRKYNIDEQYAYASAGVVVQSTVSPYNDNDGDSDDSTMNLSATAYAAADCAIGMTAFGSASSMSTSYTNVAVCGTSYNPNFGVDIGGPVSASALATGTYASGGVDGEGRSRATMIVGCPTVPNSPMVMTGTLDLAFLDLNGSSGFNYLDIRIGNTTIYGSTGEGWYIYINHAGSAPEDYWTPDLPNDVFEFSQYVSCSEQIPIDIYSYFGSGVESRYSTGGGTNELWPETNIFAELAVNTY